MGIKDILERKRDEILRIAKKHGAYNVRVFGSVARGDARPDSDIDFLVEVGPGRTAFFPGGLIVDLEDLLGRRIEVATLKGLNSLIREKVISEAVPL